MQVVTQVRRSRSGFRQNRGISAWGVGASAVCLLCARMRDLPAHHCQVLVGGRVCCEGCQGRLLRPEIWMKIGHGVTSYRIWVVGCVKGMDRADKLGSCDIDLI